MGMDLGLKGQSVLITGASKGIGLATARAFAAEGCKLHLTARSGDALAGAKDEISRKHGVSVSRLRDGPRASRRTSPSSGARCADVDILINNAGDIPAGSMEIARRGRLAARLRPQGLRLHHPDARALPSDEGRGRRDHQQHRQFRRELGRQLHRGQHRQRRADGVHQGARRREPAITASASSASIPARSRPSAWSRSMKRRAIDMVRRREPLGGTVRANIPAGARRPRRRSRISWCSSPRRAAGYITGTIVTIDGGIASRGSVIKERSVQTQCSELRGPQPLFRPAVQHAGPHVARAEHQPHPTHPAVRQAMIDSIDAGEYHAYAPPLGFEALRGADRRGSRPARCVGAGDRGRRQGAATTSAAPLRAGHHTS